MSLIAVFLNPHAGKNRRAGPAHGQRLAQLLGDLGTVHVTQTLDELGVAVRQALASRTRYFVADGGDGSLHCLLDALRQALADAGRDVDALPPVAPTRSGSIDFVARKVGLRLRTEALLRRLVAEVRSGRPPSTVALPTLRVTGERWDAVSGTGVPFERLGFALAAGGVGQRFFDKYSREVPGPTAVVRVVGKAIGSRLLAHSPLGPWLPGPARDYGEEVFRPTRARVTIDGAALPTEHHGAIHAGAFDLSLGGVFRVFPLATRPGQLHFQAGTIAPGEMIAALPRLVRGRTLGFEGLLETAGREMIVESRGEELLRPVLDGEDLESVVRLTVTPGPVVPVVALGEERPNETEATRSQAAPTG